MADHFETSLRSVMSGERRGVRASSLRVALSIAEPFYWAITAIRNRLFEWGIRHSRKLPVPVISVGNLTTGGTGKTPLVAWIVQALHRDGHSPAVLMRGYRRDDREFADEEQLYRSQFAGLVPSVQIVASPRRYDAGMKAMQSASPPDVFVLDDGFQHRQLARDLDLVLIDATNPFGYGHVLPRGMLRESPAGLSRANAIIITRSDQIPAEELARLRSHLQRLHSGAPIIECRNELEDLSALTGKKLFAFCGIGNPESFWRLLTRAGFNLVGTRAFNDHQGYSEELLRSISSQARSSKADLLVTTEKDWTKIAPAVSSLPLPVVSIRMNVNFAADDAEKLQQLLRTTATKK